MKLFSRMLSVVAVAATLAFSGAAFAANDSDISQNGPCNIALVGQAGGNWSIVSQGNPGDCSKGNRSEVHQRGYNGQATIQMGKKNDAYTNQKGFVNLAVTYQDGNRNTSGIGQDGAFNIGGSIQLGKDNSSSVWQGGNGNLGGVLQMGDDNSSSIGQNGDGNLAVAVQLGDDNSSSIGQNGNGNVAVVVQESW